MACSCPKKMYSGLAAFAFVFVNKFLDAGRGALRRAQAGMCGAARACVPRSRGGAWRRLSTLLLAAVLGLNLPARSGAQYKAGAACSGYAHRWQATDSSVSGSTVLDTGTGPQANAVLTGTATYNSTGGLFTVQGSPAGYLTLGSLTFTCAPRCKGLQGAACIRFHLFLHPQAQPWCAPVRSQYTIAFWARIDSTSGNPVLFRFEDGPGTYGVVAKFNPTAPYWCAPGLSSEILANTLVILIFFCMSPTGPPKKVRLPWGDYRCLYQADRWDLPHKRGVEPSCHHLPGFRAYRYNVPQRSCSNGAGLVSHWGRAGGLDHGQHANR